MFQLTDIHCKNRWNPYPLGGGVHHYHFLSPPAKMIQFDLRNIFRLGWQKSHGQLTFSWLENPPCESMYLQKNMVYFPTTNQDHQPGPVNRSCSFEKLPKCFHSRMLRWWWGYAGVRRFIVLALDPTVWTWPSVVDVSGGPSSVRPLELESLWWKNFPLTSIRATRPLTGHLFGRCSRSPCLEEGSV